LQIADQKVRAAPLELRVLPRDRIARHDDIVTAAAPYAHYGFGQYMAAAQIGLHSSMDDDQAILDLRAWMQRSMTSNASIDVVVAIH
jgi:hypothetical protein